MRKYIILLLLAICTQLSADVLGKDTNIKGTAKLNGKTLDIDYTVNQNSKSTGTVGTIEILCGNTIGLSVTTSKKRAKISTDDQPIGQQHHYTMENVDTKGAVFVRVAAKTSETSYYNYSTLLKLK